ncbi:MAG: aminopeptidase [Myxococcota bacterium]|nr:aminopeptidase [Myxococcota bacterium]
MTSTKTTTTGKTKRLRRLFGIGATVGLAGLLGSTFNACYVARSTWFQAELLLAREAIDDVRASGVLTEDQIRKLDLIADVKAFGEELGLSATANYDRIAWEWDRTIWNLSACAPLSFDSKTWWFPVVGTVPYLGFFRRQDANKWLDRLSEEGLDVYLRTAGAYSTLGYFEDPILPGMLEWENDALANTVLHEMVHATVWIRGSVAFNESLASFVGNEASKDYLIAKHGPEADEVRESEERRADRRAWRSLQQELFGDLNSVYANPTLSPADKRLMKEHLFNTLVNRVERIPFHHPERFVDAATNGTWNNARLMQFKAYNSYQQEFGALLQSVDGNYVQFLGKVNEIVSGASDPFEALLDATRVQNF